MNRSSLCIRIAGCLALVGAVAAADDWPTYRHDNQRSGVTEEALTLPLAEAWVHAPALPPAPAWEGPAKWDAYSGQRDLKSMRNFDPVYYVTAAGGRVYYGSNAEDAAVCLDAATGAPQWTRIVGGPVRLPPAFAADKVYFGSDDGYAYCAEAGTGTIRWQFSPAPDMRLIPVNGKLISMAPCRTGVLIEAGRAYFGMSLLPWEPSFLCAVDAATGAADAPGCFAAGQQEATFQGALLASPDRLYALQGRSAPVVFARATGERQGVIGAAGGVFALLTADQHFVGAPRSQKVTAFAEAEAASADQLASYEGANRIVVGDGVAYLHSGEELSAFDRARYLGIAAQIREASAKRDDIEKQLKERAYNVFTPEGKVLAAQLNEAKKQVEEHTAELPSCFLWRVKSPHPHELIKAGSLLFAGGDAEVAAYQSSDGTQVWHARVDGKAHGLAAAGGRLYVSTDTGSIYCFAPAT